MLVAALVHELPEPPEEGWRESLHAQYHVKVVRHAEWDVLFSEVHVTSAAAYQYIAVLKVGKERLEGLKPGYHWNSSIRRSISI